MGDEVTLDTPVSALIERHLERLADDDRSLVTISTYKFAAKKLNKFISALRVHEATPARIDAAIRSMRATHGATMARQSKTILRGALQLAVMASVVHANPVRDIQAIRSKAQPKGAIALTSEQLRELLAKLHRSTYCQNQDLVDPVTVLIATGLRRSELLALRWIDFDAEAAELSVTGKLVRATGHGLRRIDETESAAGKRTLPLPQFAVNVLRSRRGRAFVGEQPMIFPSTTGAWRDPNNFGKQWRAVREDLGAPEITTHSFRKTVATLIDDAGLSARVGADQLGHTKVSMTQDNYMARNRVHTEVAELLDRAISDE
nr:site-specific integrase [Mycobacterium scrofulaceum]